MSVSELHCILFTPKFPLSWGCIQPKASTRYIVSAWLVALGGSPNLRYIVCLASRKPPLLCATSTPGNMPCMCNAANTTASTMGAAPQKYLPLACQTTSPRLLVCVGGGRGKDDIKAYTIPNFAQAQVKRGLLQVLSRRDINMHRPYPT